MPKLKLSKLPDRTPIRITVSITPDLHAALTAYADAYQVAYGSAESVSELIPYMLAAFIESDNGFRKARRGPDAAPNGAGRDVPASRRGNASATPPASPGAPTNIN